ncbi:MAG: AAA family ATPase, partial [Lachnospiraceae bacterium]|nr:AAA family ATPase [Lachnospiraceae bacterium]
MLLGLHVKNLALIEKADVEFAEGLNILTGETGAGKSIIIESVGLALGGKASKDMIRQGEESAYVELVFSVDEEEKREALAALDIVPDEEGLLIISKKITQTRSTSRINDETVTASRLRAVTGLLLDMHGQHEHQSLLHKQKHLEILDEYSRNETEQLKMKVADGYKKYQSLKDALAGFSLDEEGRRREADFTRFEIEEIENAGLRP